MTHQFDLLRDRHLDTAFAGKVANGQTTLHAFGGLSGRRLSLFQRLAPAEVLAKRTVARQRRHTRTDEVTKPRQPGEGEGVSAEADAKPSRLSQPSGYQRRLGVVSEAHANRHTAGERDDVLHCAAELTADDIVIRVRPEVRRDDGLLHHGRPVLIDAGDNRRGRLPEREFAGQIRTGQNDDSGGIDLGDFRDDLAHPIAGAELDALHQADERGIAADRAGRRPLREVAAQCL